MTQTNDPKAPMQETAKPLLSVPYHPLVILIPASNHSPSPLAVKLLKEQCQDFVTFRKKYTITASPINYAPSKNDFFSLAPAWWQKADGTWEHRDGLRNPIADAATCQKELERMAMTVHTLAQGYKHLQTPDPALSQACLKRADNILRMFFLDEETRMLPEVRYSQCIPNTEPLKGNANFIIATRYLILVAQALCMLPKTFASRQGVEAWFDAHIKWMTTSPQGQEATQLKNKMSRWYHAALASYLRISNPTASVEHANRIMSDLLAEHPQPVETLFVGALSRPRPRHNTLFALEPLVILASLTIPDCLSPVSDGLQINMDSDRLTKAAPSEAILMWLEKVVSMAAQAQPGAIEINVDSDERQEIKLGFFLRQVWRWRGKHVTDVEVDGKSWEGGWREWSKLAWLMI